MTSYQSSIKKGLPKETKSVCPVCHQVIDARIYEEDGKVMISKDCPDHGNFKDIYWSDVEAYLQAEKYAYDGHVERINYEVKEGCPYDCGLCEEHLSTTILANIDLTNRCNLNCSFCFANANVKGFVYEPSFEEVVEMLKALRAENPPCPAVQFAGGEPTLRKDLFDIIKIAKEMKFSQVQLATNGIKLKDIDFVKKLKEARLSTIYLHFDGFTPNVEPYLDIKREVIENCRKCDIGVVLVPTVFRGFNDQQIGDFINFAVDNIDVIRGINYQPISFSGRATEDERDKMRFTIPDLLDEIERQTHGRVLKKDFYPVPCVIPISKLAEVYKGKSQIEFSAHPHCGLATYLFVDKQNMDELIPINRFVDVDKFFEGIEQIVDNLSKKGIINKVKAIKSGLDVIFKYVDNSKKPSSLNFTGMIESILINQDYKSLGNFHKNALFIGSMHFQDLYNMDLERLKRCVIHYATPSPERRIIPFCAYNTLYREEIEKKYSIPLSEWREKYGDEKE